MENFLTDNVHYHCYYSKMAVFWDVALCSLVDTDCCFRGAYYLHHLGDHHSDVGGSKHLWNVSQYLQDYKAKHPRRQPSSYCHCENLKSHCYYSYRLIHEKQKKSFHTDNTRNKKCVQTCGGDTWNVTTRRELWRLWVCYQRVSYIFG
jgi:hypothetical protein